MWQVLIVSYETFRIHADRMRGKNACDLLICDEAHRLKNDATLTNKALDGLACKRRVLLSGTPMQNHLDEVCYPRPLCDVLNLKVATSWLLLSAPESWSEGRLVVWNPSIKPSNYWCSACPRVYVMAVCTPSTS